jgi:ABC-2 type transport system ATP-binding protein
MYGSFKMSDEIVIEVRGLGKKYGRLTALEKLDFNIRKGEIFGLVGPNGAGKSTFISILTTLSKPSGGDIFINSFSVTRQPKKIKGKIGFVPQDIALYPMLSGLDNLSFWAGIYGLRGDLKKERLKEALSVVKLEERAKDRVSEYSGGMKRRLNIAVALLHHPEILVMDEPTVGVDIQSRKLILEALKRLKSEGRTIVFTSHNIDELESISDRIAIMNKGSIIAVGTPKELKESYGTESISEILLQLIG